MLTSILPRDDRNKCYVCGSTRNLEVHHIIFGMGNRRKVAEKNGFKCTLCAECHRGNHGVHHDRILDITLKRICQDEFEKTHSREEWMRIVGRNYMNDD